MCTWHAAFNQIVEYGRRRRRGAGGRGRPNREGHRRRRGAGGRGRPNPEGHRRRRRGARGGGRPQRVPDRLIKHEEKTEMRETPKKPDLTGNLQSIEKFR